MGTLKLSLLPGVVFLALSAAAPAQPCRFCTAESVDVPLKDDSGNVRVIMRLWAGEPGKRRIQFLDPQKGVINEVTQPDPAPPAIADNALRGDPVPDVLAPDQGKADADEDIHWLTLQVNALKDQVRLLRDRINAAAAR